MEIFLDFFHFLTVFQSHQGHMEVNIAFPVLFVNEFSHRVSLLIGQLQHRQFGPRGVLRSLESGLTLFNIFPFPRCSFPTTSFWSILRVLRSLDSGLTHSTFFYLLRRSFPTTTFLDHMEMNTTVIAGSVALDGMKVDTIFYWSFFASPFARPLVEKSFGQEIPGVPRIQKMPASGISSELSAHQMARSEIVPASGISSELGAHQISCARQFRDAVSPHTGRFPHVQQWARCNP